MLAARPETERYFPGIMAGDSPRRSVRSALEMTLQHRLRDRKGSSPRQPARELPWKLPFPVWSSPKSTGQWTRQSLWLYLRGPKISAFPRSSFPVSERQSVRVGRRINEEEAGHLGSYDNHHFRSVPLYLPPQLGPREICIPLPALRGRLLEEGPPKARYSPR